MAMGAIPLWTFSAFAITLGVASCASSSDSASEKLAIVNGASRDAAKTIWTQGGNQLAFFDDGTGYFRSHANAGATCCPVPPSCVGLTFCGDACVDTRSDIANCGACGNVCTADAGSIAECSNSTCLQRSGGGNGPSEGSTVVPCDDQGPFSWQQLSEGVLLLDKGPYTTLRNVHGSVQQATFTATIPSGNGTTEVRFDLRAGTVCDL